ncbi:MAG: amidohydrolase family protein [Nocardia sp.]|nr:amidohydrolase family protein [Nocardia sp.]
MYGEVAEPLIDAVVTASEAGVAIVENPDLEADEAEINADTVWNLKMEKAPGAFDLDRRIEVLDFTGIRRQILYPDIAAITTFALYNKAHDRNVFRSITGDRRGYALRLMDIYNGWCGEVSRSYDRLRPAALLVGDTPEEMISKADKLVKSGVRAVMLAGDELPGGVSPASNLLDPMWATLAEAKCPVLMHISVSENFLKTLEWRNAPAFEGWMAGAEFSLDPWTMTSVHLPVQNYLATMILGGVFDRHPDLMFGASEFTGHWVGPMAENMDRFYGSTPFPTAQGFTKLQLRPSEYVSRNVRITCFHFEDVGTYIDRYGFEDVFCYASDYPHHEGGRDPMNSFVRSLSGKGAGTLQKFFVDNGGALLAD